MISRIFHLQDTTTNAGNFGKTIVVAQTTNKWKLIDFRAPSPDQSVYYKDEKIVQGFEAGNGVFNYANNTFLGYMFRNKEFTVQKFALALEVVNELTTGKPRTNTVDRKMSLHLAIDKARKEIITYIDTYHEKMKVPLDTAKADLEEYIAAVIFNFDLLAKGISVKHQEIMAPMPIDDGSSSLIVQHPSTPTTTTPKF